MMMRIFKTVLKFAWLAVAAVAIAPTAVIATALWEVSDRYIEAGLLPMTDPPAERAASAWLKGRGKSNVVIQFEIDREYSHCPRRTRCYWYAATDGQGRFEEGGVWTKPSDPTAFSLARVLDETRARSAGEGVDTPSRQQ